MRRYSKGIARFLLLRLAEFIFALFSLTAVLMLGEGERQESLHQGMSALAHIFAHLEFSLLITVAYIIGSFYVPLSLLCFIAAEYIWGISERNISYLNSIPYALFGIFGVLQITSGENAYLAWLVWGSIVAFNFYSPRLLK